jgi:hypothetical protein
MLVMLVSNRSRNWRWNTVRPRTGHALGSSSSGFKAQREYMYKRTKIATPYCVLRYIHEHAQHAVTKNQKNTNTTKYNFTYMIHVR